MNAEHYKARIGKALQRWASVQGVWRAKSFSLGRPSTVMASPRAKPPSKYFKNEGRNEGGYEGA